MSQIDKKNSIPYKNYNWQNEDIQNLIKEWVKIGVVDNWRVNFNKKAHLGSYNDEGDNVIILDDFLWFNYNAKVGDKIALWNPTEWIWHKYIGWWRVWIIEQINWNKIFFKIIVNNHIEEYNKFERKKFDQEKKLMSNSIKINYIWIFFWLLIILIFISLIKYIIK